MMETHIHTMEDGIAIAIWVIPIFHFNVPFHPYYFWTALEKYQYYKSKQITTANNFTSLNFPLAYIQCVVLMRISRKDM